MSLTPPNGTNNRVTAMCKKSVKNCTASHDENADAEWTEGDNFISERADSTGLSRSLSRIWSGSRDTGAEKTESLTCLTGGGGTESVTQSRTHNGSSAKTQA